MAKLFSEKNEGKHRRRKVGKSCVTPAGTSTNLTSRINGIKHTHAHTHSITVGFSPILPLCS